MLGTKGPRSRPCRPINVTCWCATGKLLKKNYHLGYAHRQGRDGGKGRGKGEGAASCAIVNSRENATKAENADEVAAIKRCHTMHHATLCCASREIKQSWRQKCVVALLCVHACVCVCVCNCKQSTGRRDTHTNFYAMHIKTEAKS